MMRFSGRAFSLIEMLICSAIIMILTGISVVCYQGSLDNSELRGVLPQVVDSIKGVQSRASRENALIVAEFIDGDSIIGLTIKKASGTSAEKINLTSRGLFKRRLVFRSYRWNDGANAPRTFTFTPGGLPQGGAVCFGTAFAEGKIFINDGVIDWSRM